MAASFCPSTLPLARVPRWLKAPDVAGTKVVQRLVKTAQATMTMATSALAKGFHAHAKAPSFLALRHRSLTKIATLKAVASVKAIPAKEAPALHCGPQPSVSFAMLGRVTTITDIGVAECITHFGESFDLLSLRKTLVRLQEELAFCLSGLAFFEGGLLGSGPKPCGKAFASRPKPRIRFPKELASLGFRDPQPKSKKTLGFSLAPVSLAPARHPKGEASMAFTLNWLKFVFEAKVVWGPCSEEASSGFYEPLPISDPFIQEFSLGSGVGQPGDPGASSSSLEAFSPGSDAGLLSPAGCVPTTPRLPATEGNLCTVSPGGAFGDPVSSLLQAALDPSEGKASMSLVISFFSGGASSSARQQSCLWILQRSRFFPVGSLALPSLFRSLWWVRDGVTFFLLLQLRWGLNPPLWLCSLLSLLQQSLSSSL